MGLRFLYGFRALGFFGFYKGLGFRVLGFWASRRILGLGIGIRV